MYDYMKVIPEGCIPCWRIDEEDVSLKSIPYARGNPGEYFRLTERFDDLFIMGNLGIIGEGFVNQYDDRIVFIRDHLANKNVYFSFDRIVLYRLVEMSETRPVSFMLKRIKSPEKINFDNVFMIMPFAYKDLKEFYNQNIKTYLKSEFNIEVSRADDFCDNDIIIDTIYKQIDNSEFIIAETTYCNKNVFYEIGYAEAKKKEIITLQNTDIDPIHFFDRAHIRTILYSMNELQTFLENFNKTITTVRNKIQSRY